MDSDTPGSLEDELRELRERVAFLEEALAQRGIIRPKPVAGPSTSTSQRRVSSFRKTEDARPSPDDREPPVLKATREAPPERTLESRIGSQWFNRVGIIAVLIGMAWFLKLAIDNQWVGPVARLVIGLIAGGALIAWSERFRSRGYTAFSYSLKSIGSGLLYLSLWAAFSLYHLISGAIAFAGMIAITTFNGYLAWAQNAELLAFYAIAGAYITPLLISSNENREIALFSYLLLLDLSVIVLVAMRPWARLLFPAFVGTVFYAAGWYFHFYSSGQIVTTALFFVSFFVLFAIGPRLAGVEQLRIFLVGDSRANETVLRWNQLATVLLPTLNALAGFSALLLLLHSQNAAWSQPWLAAAFAGFYLFLRAPLPARWRAQSRLLADLHLALAVVFLTMAIAFALSGRWIVIAWFVEGASLFWVASRTRSLLPRIMAAFCISLAMLILLLSSSHASFTPVFNQRFGAYFAGVAAFAFVAFIAARANQDEKRSGILRWSSIAAVATLCCNALILIAFLLEIHSFWDRPSLLNQTTQHRDLLVYTQFSYSAFVTIFGAVLLFAGFARRSAFLRWQALVLLACAIAKVFLIDINTLREGYRVLSFLGLGALLLLISFLYQRDWFRLRGDIGRAD